MKDIFANLYKKVLNFFNKTDSKGENAKDVACNRLKLVLMQDRTNLTPAIMERMRRELIELLSKYVELDRELLDLNFEHEDEQMALMLSIPVIRAKEEDEVLAILDKEDEERRRLKEILGEEDDDSDYDSDYDDDDDDIDDELEEDNNDEPGSEETSEVKSKKQLKKEKFFNKKKKSGSKPKNQKDNIEEDQVDSEVDESEQETYSEEKPTPDSQEPESDQEKTDNNESES